MPVLPPSPRAIVAVQYLRAIAALMVVWYHAAGQVPGMSALIPSSFGTSGVDLFFVISGFIMVVTTSGKAVTAAAFWRRRIVRVVPLYWLLTLAMVALALVAPGLFKTLRVEPMTLLQSLFFVPHFSRSFPDQIWPLLVPGWTLNFEMFFYALFGASLVLPSRWRLATLGACLLALAGTGAAFGPFESAAARIYTHPMLIEFLAGMAVGAAWRRGLLRLSMATSTLLLAVGFVLLLSHDIAWPAYLPQTVGAGLVLAGALHPRLSAWHSRVGQAIGDASYSLYLTHLFTLGALRVAWAALVPGLPNGPTTAAFMLLALVTCAAAGWLSYRLLERPLLRLLNERTAPAAPVTPAAPSTGRSAAFEP